MDQLTAYRILQLMPGSTRREIREAYARLAKEYHPEEHPKEFNQIQEAYQLLTGRGENWSSDAVDDWFSDGEKTESEWESEEEFWNITAEMVKNPNSAELVKKLNAFFDPMKK